MQITFTIAEHPASERNAEVSWDDALEKEVRARLEQVQQVLVLEGEVVQVVQQVVDQRGAVHRVQARLIKRAQTWVHAKVGEINESVED